MRIQIRKWGNCLALKIPKLSATESHIEQGSIVDLVVMEGKLIITPVAETDYSLDDLLAGVTKLNLHQTVITGEPVARISHKVLAKDAPEGL